MAIKIVRPSETQHRGYSEVLRLELWWDNEMLCFRAPAPGEYLPTPDQFGAARLAAEARASSSQSRADSTESKVSRA